MFPSLSFLFKTHALWPVEDERGREGKGLNGRGEGGCGEVRGRWGRLHGRGEGGLEGVCGGGGVAM